MAQGTTSTTAAARREPLLVDLALQGGGAHGAFTWGVIDRLLEELWLEFDGISGTSAGAMNAAVTADGFAASGREGARVALEAFWRRVAGAATFSPFRRTPEIDGEAYWDGGYSGNPTITPLVRECRSQDTIIVPINPVERPGTREFLAMLRDEGRHAADVFLAEHGDALGHRSSMDLDILLREV
jgi:predicted acylesterase/phospholipase RssA